MRKVSLFFVLVALLVAIVMPVSANQADADAAQACYGLVSAAYAQAGLQGEHASSFAGDPRIGIANLAVLLADLGVIDEPTMWSLGQWLDAQLGLDISACDY